MREVANGLGTDQMWQQGVAPKSADSSEVEGAYFLHLVVAVPVERTVPRGLSTKHSFFFKRAQKDGFWTPIAIGDLKSISALCFDQSFAACENDDEQNKHIGDMTLMIDGVVVLTDQ